jgi:hypothetical protein
MNLLFVKWTQKNPEFEAGFLLGAGLTDYLPVVKAQRKTTEMPTPPGMAELRPGIGRQEAGAENRHWEK